MVRSKIIVVSEDPNMVHQTRQYAESHGWQCEVHSPQDWQRLQQGNAQQGVPALSFGSATVGEGGKVLQFPQPSSVLTPNSGSADANVETINDLEAKAIENAIHIYRGNLTEAAKALGIGRATLYRKVKQYNIDPSQARKRRVA